MKLQTFTPNMMVDDVNETVAFYRDVLGFNLVMSVPEAGSLDWALVRRDEVEVMFQARASLTEEIPMFKDLPIGGALSFYIDMQGVEALFEQISPRVTVIQDLHVTFYGRREFAIQDCNGFILTFAEGVDP
ncbi:MAG: VOC family protein [Rhodothermales bacterium]